MAAKYYTDGNSLRYLSRSWMHMTESPRKRVIPLLPLIIIIGVATAGLWYGFRQIYADVVFPTNLFAEQGQDWYASLQFFLATTTPTPFIILGASFIIAHLAILLWKVRTFALSADAPKAKSSWKRLLQLWLNDVLSLVLAILLCALLFGIHRLFAKAAEMPFWIEPTVIGLLLGVLGLWLLTLRIISQQHILAEGSAAPKALWLALTQHADFQKWLLLGFMATLCGLTLGIVLSFPALILCATDIIAAKAAYLSDNTLIPSYFPTALYATLIICCAAFFLVQTWTFLAYTLCFSQSSRITYKDNYDTRTN